jgi:tetratricopeptide (TPR) repeat protein
MDEPPNKAQGFAPAKLPWIIGFAALVVYGVTLNPWVSFQSIRSTGMALGFDWWNFQITQPLFNLLGALMQWLPGGIQVFALNIVTAVFAALTLMLLARTVALLPHDRTQDQRLRNTSENFALLKIPTAWLPPVGAVFVCGWQLTFWEHATVGTGEMLNLLLFAYVVRCLAEYRISLRESWLYRLALVYGIGMATNWAMIGFLPVCLTAILILKGMQFFQPKFLLRMISLGLLGLLFYFYNPIMGAMNASEPTSFGKLLQWEFVNQRNALLAPTRTGVLLLSLSSVASFVMLIARWPGNFGDVSGFGAAVTKFLFRAIHIFFLGTLIWVAFDGVYSPRNPRLGYGRAMLPFYYLGAVMVGYLVGYFLLLGAVEPAKKWQRSGTGRMINRLLSAVVLIGAVAVPVLLLQKNLPTIRAENGRFSRQYVEQIIAELPEAGSLLLSQRDDVSLMIEAAFLGKRNPHFVTRVPRLVDPRFHFRASRRHKEWPDPGDYGEKQRLDARGVFVFLAQMSNLKPIWSLETIAGTLLSENGIPSARGPVFQYGPYPTNSPYAPELSAELAAVQAKSSADLAEFIKSFLPSLETKARSMEQLGRLYSARANRLGAALQSQGKNEAARMWFEQALALYADNQCATINLDANEALRAGEPGISNRRDLLEEGLDKNGTWERLLDANGPVDEMETRLHFGDMLARGGFYRQAAGEYRRAIALAPTNYIASLKLADSLLQGRYPVLAESALAQYRSVAATNTVPAGAAAEHARIDVLLDYSGRNHEEIAIRLKGAVDRHPNNVMLMNSLSDVHINAHQFTNAITVLERILKLAPEHLSAMGNLGAAYAQVGRFQDSLDVLDRLVAKSAADPNAHLNRGLPLRKLDRLEEAEATYLEALELNPNLLPAMLGLGYTEIAKDNRPAAVVHFEKWRARISPANPLYGEITALVAKLKGKD